MTAVGTAPVVGSWNEPDGIAPRGTVVVVPGRGEHAGVYERFGRRIAADGYRVRAVADPTVDEAGVRAQVRELLATDPDVGPRPLVLVGSDTGALFVAALATEGSGVDGLVLAGLVAPARTAPAPAALDAWDEELTARTACPTHQARLTGDGAVRRGALATPPPAQWFDRAHPETIGVPVLGLHGAADVVSPLADVRGWYAAVPSAELVSIVDGGHDGLNDQTHRTVAATVVLFLERLRRGADAPALARTELLR
jgi:alpha-beta hydrolase superfamily lysophospholipase